ncbi:hypothetical protein PIB30_037436 [Stylosanthes scabra]|uniref:Uncharacterized protein n=1 Tax=Stylosanthes scabra TaxID=79078 RepID=A0ABU6REF0_9FABA|nr:hypothetical protein [Stylosanthes scabra]
MAALDEPKSTTFDSGEPYLGLVLSNRRAREDRLVALVIPQAGNLRFSPPSSYTTQDFFSLLSLLHDETYRTVLPTSGCFVPARRLLLVLLVAFTGSASAHLLHPYHRWLRHQLQALCTPFRVLLCVTCGAIAAYSLAAEWHHLLLLPLHLLLATMSLPSRCEPNEPYVAEHVPYRAPEAYYSDVSYGSKRESASTETAPSSHHSSGSSSGSVSLGYGSASSGSASDGASDDDLVNRYFAGTFPPP